MFAITLIKMDKTQLCNQPKEQYVSPEVYLMDVEIEKGFLNSTGNKIPGFDDNGAPSIPDVMGFRTDFPDYSF